MSGFCQAQSRDTAKWPTATFAYYRVAKLLNGGRLMPLKNSSSPNKLLNTGIIVDKTYVQHLQRQIAVCG